MTTEDTTQMVAGSILDPEQWKARVGTEVGVSDWISVGQALIDDFAQVTDDHQFIHVDPRRAAAESPFGGTVAHGFLTLGLLPAMARSALPALSGVLARINYGFDRIRFLAPVPSGAKVRARFRLAKLEERRPKELTLTYDVTVEIDGEEAPALAAVWISRLLLADDA